MKPAVGLALGVLLAAALAAAGAARAQTDPTEGDTPRAPRAAPDERVPSLLPPLLTGNATAAARPRHYEIELDAPKELHEALLERTLLGRWQRDPNYEPEQLPLFVERAREEAVAIAQAAGYFSAQATVTERTGADGRPVVRIELDAGARTTVNRFVLEVTGPAAGTRLVGQLHDDWPLPEGAFFRSEDWTLGKRKLLEELQQAGYLRARIVQSRAEVDPALTAASLEVTVDSGPRLRFGPVSVKGLDRYPRSIVDGLQPFAPGDPYRFQALMQWQQRLGATGQFGSVSVRPDLAAIEQDPQRLDVPVIVELRERRQQNVSLGIGYSTDQGVRGMAAYDHRNLFDRGWILNSSILVEQIRRQAYVSGRTPQEADGWFNEVGLRYERTDITGQLTETGTVFGGRGRRREMTDWFVSVQYQDDRTVVDQAPGVTPLETSHALTLGHAWNLRRLDSRIDPGEGFTVSTQVSGALDGLASTASFVRLYARGMFFWPLPKAWGLGGGMFVGRLEGGWVVSESADGIPSPNLFRTGGSESVRGYDFLSLGVKQGSATVGGRVLGVGSIEYQHPISGPWYAAAFVDAGNAADTWQTWRAVFGYGAGVRWRSPIGPIRLDVAYGEADRQWKVHFSVGYVF